MKKVKCKLFNNRKLYCTGFGYISRAELAHILRNREYEVEFGDDGPKILLSVLKEIEPKEGDVTLLTRVVKEGGFTQYIEKLESRA